MSNNPKFHKILKNHFKAYNKVYSSFAEAEDFDKLFSSVFPKLQNADFTSEICSIVEEAFNQVVDLIGNTHFHYRDFFKVFAKFGGLEKDFLVNQSADDSGNIASKGLIQKLPEIIKKFLEEFEDFDGPKGKKLRSYIWLSCYDSSYKGLIEESIDYIQKEGLTLEIFDRMLYQQFLCNQTVTNDTDIKPGQIREELKDLAHPEFDWFALQPVIKKLENAFRSTPLIFIQNIGRFFGFMANNHEDWQIKNKPSLQYKQEKILYVFLKLKSTFDPIDSEELMSALLPLNGYLRYTSRFMSVDYIDEIERFVKGVKFENTGQYDRILSFLKKFPETEKVYRDAGIPYNVGLFDMELTKNDVNYAEVLDQWVNDGFGKISEEFKTNITPLGLMLSVKRAEEHINSIDTIYSYYDDTFIDFGKAFKYSGYAKDLGYIVHLLHENEYEIKENPCRAFGYPGKSSRLLEPGRYELESKQLYERLIQYHDNFKNYNYIEELFENEESRKLLDDYAMLHDYYFETKYDRNSKPWYEINQKELKKKYPHRKPTDFDAFIEDYLKVMDKDRSHLWIHVLRKKLMSIRGAQANKDLKSMLTRILQMAILFPGINEQLKFDRRYDSFNSYTIDQILEDRVGEYTSITGNGIPQEYRQEIDEMIKEQDELKEKFESFEFFEVTNRVKPLSPFFAVARGKLACDCTFEHPWWSLEHNFRFFVMETGDKVFYTGYIGLFTAIQPDGTKTLLVDTIQPMFANPEEQELRNLLAGILFSVDGEGFEGLAFSTEKFASWNYPKKSINIIKEMKEYQEGKLVTLEPLDKESWNLFCKYLGNIPHHSFTTNKQFKYIPAEAFSSETGQIMAL